MERVCSRIAILQKGEIRAYDTVENLRKKSSKPAVEIALSSNEQVEKVLILLNSLDYVSECQRDDLRVTAIMKGEETSTILSVLMKDGIKVEEVKKVTMPLEDIYLNIVNQSEGKI